MAASLVEKLKETLVGGSQTQENQPQHHQEGSSFPDNAVEPASQKQHVRFSNGHENLEATSHDTQRPVKQNVDSLVDLAYETSNKPSRRQEPRNDVPTSNGPSGHQEPLDAARVPPSVFSQHLGGPQIEHDYPHESSARRHSSVSHQEAHYLK